MAQDETTVGFEVFPLQRWRVSLPWCGHLDIDADTSAEAIRVYNERLGSWESAHRHSVEPLLGE